MFKKAKKLYEKGMTQVEVAEQLGTTQKVIWGLFKRNNYKCRIARKRNQWGENNHSWVGNKAKCVETYHRRLNRKHGSPKKCEVCGSTTAKCYHWANLTGNYPDLEDYKRMCASCHAKYDNKARHFKGGDAI